MADTTITFDRFVERYPSASFSKGEIIVFQGETPRNAYVVREGTVKAYNLSVQGDEKPVDFYTSLDIFPVPWAFGKAPNAYFYYEAFTDVTLYTIPRQEFVDYLRTNPDYMYKLLNSFVMGYLGNSMRLNALQHSRASDKLLYTLHYLTLTHGHEIGPRQIEITLSLTHQDFANLTGLTRETAATELNKLKTAKVIMYGKHTLYQVDLNKLQEVINDQFIADVESSLKPQ